MHRVQISRLARKDLLDTLEYIRDDLENPSAAERIGTTILQRIEALQNFPMQGMDLGKIIENEGGYRYLICENYLIFYRVERNTVYVDRILHGSQDYLRILFPCEG